MRFDPVAYINEPRWRESRLGLERIAELLDRMGRPQDRLRFVHVAGTNGKGSVCAFLASVLQEAGLRTGLFTSPYIIEFAERIRVDGRNIPEGDLRDVTLFVREHAEAMAAAGEDNENGEGREDGPGHPTEFELMTAVAFEHFARAECDIVVCEVGLGGRLDSTNVIEAPAACVIARIGLDHTALLGNTLAEIACEKAGIIKPGAAVVSWPQEPEAMRVIEQVAAAQGCELVVADVPAGAARRRLNEYNKGIDKGAALYREFEYGGREWRTQLLGSYQPANAALAIEALRVLRRRGWNIPDEAIARGIEDARWPGRFELVEAGPPPIVVDGGHNPQGAKALADSLRDVFPACAAVFVMSVLADKDYRSMIREAAPLAKAFVCAQPLNPRALPGSELAATVRECAPGISVVEAADFTQAMSEARRLAGLEDVICAFGSLYSIAGIKRACGE